MFSKRLTPSQMEYWNYGIMGAEDFDPVNKDNLIFTHYSNLPTFQHSNIPVLKPIYRQIRLATKQAF
jgi:hypothetical protein